MMSNSYRVKQCFPPHGDIEGDVKVGLVAASVELHIPLRKVSFSENLFWVKNWNLNLISGLYINEGPLV